MSKEIADAFGLHPDSLELVESDEDVTNARPCPSCEEMERKCAELAAEFAECRSDLERCQYQIEQLLRISPASTATVDPEKPVPP